MYIYKDLNGFMHFVLVQCWSMFFNHRRSAVLHFAHKWLEHHSTFLSTSSVLVGDDGRHEFLAVTLPLGKHPRYHGGSMEMNVLAY